MTHSDSLTIRPARSSDALALLQLAELDSAQQLTGAVLLAELDGELRAAIDTDSGRAIADPFHRTAHLVELLRLRAEPAGERRVPGLRRLLRPLPRIA